MKHKGGSALRNWRCRVILSEAKNLWSATSRERGLPILRFAQNDMREGLFHGLPIWKAGFTYLDTYDLKGLGHDPL